MSDSLRDRLAAALERSLVAQFPSDLPDRYGQWIDNTELADAVIAELGLHPVESLDRRFIRWVTAWRNNPELGDSYE